MIVAIKDIEMPGCCTAYNSDNGKYEYISCPFYQSCKQRERIKTNYKPDNCPLVEIVTCKDCCNVNCSYHAHTCDLEEYRPDFYCADAERRG